MPDLIRQLKALKLHGMADCYAQLQGQGSISSEALLQQLLTAEVSDRSIRSIRYQVTSAKFPVHRDLLGFDFSRSKVDQPLVMQSKRRNAVKVS